MKHTLYDIPFSRIDGSATSLAAYRGQVLLLVNVASACGLTPQYEGLERLFTEKQAEGLMVIGFPANDFGAQEPGTNQEIVEFCSMKFGVKFPLAEKIAVRGAQQHALYACLTAAQPTATETEPGALRTKLEGHGFKQENASDVLWNFEKFLISRSGEVVGRFNPDVTPQDPVLLAAIAHELHAV